MKNMIFKRLFILTLVIATCKGGFSQSFFPAVSGSCVSDSPVELGVKFTTSDSARITALRFYKCGTSTQINTLKLYSGTTLLASVTYSGSATGWIRVPLASPVTIYPGTIYVASYFSTSGLYQAINPYNGWPAKTGPLTASGSVYAYKTVNNNTLPVNSYQNSNYFMDVVVQTIAPPPVIKDSITVNGQLYVRAATIKPCAKDSLVYPFSSPDSSVVVNLNGMNFKYFYFTKYNYSIANPDTIKIPVPDTAQLNLAWSVVDSVDYTTYLRMMKYYKVLEVIVLPDPAHRYRYVEYIDKAIRKEESTDSGLTWKRIVPSIND